MEEKLHAAMSSWGELITCCVNRRAALADSSTFYEFMQDLQELDICVEDMVSRMSAAELPTSSRGSRATFATS